MRVPATPPLRTTEQLEIDKRLNVIIKEKNAVALRELLQLGTTPCLQATYPNNSILDLHPLYTAVAEYWVEGVQIILEHLQGAASGDLLDRMNIHHFVEKPYNEQPESPRYAMQKYHYCDQPQEFCRQLFRLIDNKPMRSLLLRFSPMQQKMEDEKMVLATHQREEEKQGRELRKGEAERRKVLVEELREVSRFSTLDEIFFTIKNRKGKEFALELASLITRRGGEISTSQIKIGRQTVSVKDLVGAARIFIAQPEKLRPVSVAQVQPVKQPTSSDSQTRTFRLHQPPQIRTYSDGPYSLPKEPSISRRQLNSGSYVRKQGPKIIRDDSFFSTLEVDSPKLLSFPDKKGQNDDDAAPPKQKSRKKVVTPTNDDESVFEEAQRYNAQQIAALQQIENPHRNLMWKFLLFATVMGVAVFIRFLTDTSATESANQEALPKFRF